MLVLEKFNLQDARDLKALQARLIPFEDIRYKTDTFHFLSCDDAEWQERMNAYIKGHIGFGTKPLGMKPFFVESPEYGIGLEPTFDTIWAYSRPFGCTDRREVKPSEYRKKIVHHKAMFFSPTDILILYFCYPEVWKYICENLDQKRRVVLSTDYQRPLYTGIVLTDENGTEYDLYLKIYDVCALLGATSYQEACQLAGVEIFSEESKQLMEQYKTEMKTPYEDEVLHERFITYALNDLNCWEIFEGTARLWDKVCEENGIPPIKMHLTHGANVTEMCELIIARELGIKCDADIEELGLVDHDNPVDRRVNGKKVKTARPISNRKELLTFFNREGSAEWLATRNEDNKYKLGAVDGGRCKNELPRRTRITNVYEKGDLRKTVVVVDTDIDGCYGNGLMNQVYPVGRPTILSFKNSQTERPNLKDFQSNKAGKGLYKGFYSDLVYGLWQARFSTISPLSFDIDLLMSKIGMKPMSQDEVMQKDSEKEFQPGACNEVTGEFVMLRREVVNGVLTADMLQVLKQTATAKEWSELCEKLVLDAIIYYPKSQKVNTPTELFDSYRNENCEETKLNSKVQKETRDKRSHKWYAIDMGKNWVDKLAGLRKKYAKGTPENTFYKLIINCIYGVACSVFFPTFSNVVVANNITARARALAWMMAKSRLGQASITDGSMANLNECLYWRGSKPGLHTLANLDNLASLPARTRARLEIAPLNLDITKDWEVGSPWSIKDWYHIKDDDSKDVLVTVLSNGHQEVKGQVNVWPAFNKAEWEHMKRFFGKGIDILDKQGKAVKYNKETGDIVVTPRDGLFSFEIKEMYASASFQSQSNYYAVRADGKAICKARGSNIKRTQYLDPFAETLYGVDGKSSPVLNVLRSIHDGEPIKPEPRIFTNNVLKVRQYQKAVSSKNSNAVKERGLFPGQTTHKSSHIRPISVSMFRYLTESQYQSWKKRHEKLRDEYGWGLEGYFVDSEGSLDYDRAVIEIQNAIDAGENFLNSKPEFPTHPMKPEALEWDSDDL